MACDVVCAWLHSAGVRYDVALAHPFTGGVDWTAVAPGNGGQISRTLSQSVMTRSKCSPRNSSQDLLRTPSGSSRKRTREQPGRYPACVEACPVGARKFGNVLAYGTAVTLPVDINSNAATIAQIAAISVSLTVQSPNRDVEAGVFPRSNVQTTVWLNNCSGAATGQTNSCQ